MLEHNKKIQLAAGGSLSVKKQHKVLFVAKNRPLAMFVTKWLAQRVEGKRKRKTLLKRLHVLFAPFDEGPRRYAEHSYDQHHLEFEPVTNPPEYDLVVIDEAHHVFRDDALREAVMPYLASSNTRCMLLSDVSQSLRNDIKFPEGLKSVHLTEVVRSSKRIVAGAMQFQTAGEDQKGAMETKCHHESEGPPLKSFLFDVNEGQDRAEVYAEQTLRAVRNVTDEFSGLSLHDRLAIVVPNVEFRNMLLPALDQHMNGAYTDRKFKLVTAEEASGLMGKGVESAEDEKGAEWIIVDEISEMDGLERLIVIGVGLDSAANDDTSDHLETRSMLYRAMTRAHMMVSVVQECVRCQSAFCQPSIVCQHSAMLY